MTIALVLFALAALGGVIMAAMRLRGAERPPTGSPWRTGPWRQLDWLRSSSRW
jgi:hypothetical protein